jgi:phospholipase A1
MTQVAILVPGIMGSELRLDGEVVWPGPLRSLILPYQDMAKLMDPNLQATDVIRRVSFSKQYQSLIDDLEECGFKEDDKPPTLIVCPYDWRKNNRLAANIVANAVDKAVELHGPETTVSIIAHSMGGLISRYYLESDNYNTRPGFLAVRRLLTLGTPHRGSPVALSAALGMEKRLFLSAKQVKTLCSDPRYPSLYQLLPQQEEPFVWNEDSSSEFARIDIYHSRIAQALGLVQDNLEQAQEFHSKLNMVRRPHYQGQPIRYFFFAGTQQTTVSAITLLEIDKAKYRLRKAELDGAGDGTVPSWSSALTGVQGQPVGGEHSLIYRNHILRRTMAILLGKAGVLAVPSEHVEVAIREHVVHPNDRAHVILTFGSGVKEINGELRVEYSIANDEAGITFSPPTSVHPIRYTGLSAEQLSLVISAPGICGIYRVAYFPSGYDDPVGSDELFVQQRESF